MQSFLVLVFFFLVFIYFKRNWRKKKQKSNPFDEQRRQCKTISDGAKRLLSCRCHPLNSKLWMWESQWKHCCFTPELKWYGFAWCKTNFNQFSVPFHFKFQEKYFAGPFFASMPTNFKSKYYFFLAILSGLKWKESQKRNLEQILQLCTVVNKENRIPYKCFTSTQFNR